MITINLLPKDMQVVEYTSPMNLIIRGASLFVAFVALLIFIIFRFVVLDNVKKEFEDAERKRNELAVHEKMNSDLDTLIKRFKKRDDTVETVKNLRVPFSQKMSQFADVLTKKNSPIWLTSLNIARAKPVAGQKPAQAKPVAGPTILDTFTWKMDCICASAKLEPTTNFYEEIKKDRKFFYDFGGITLINSFDKIDFGENYQPSFGWKFALDLKMEVKPPEKPKNPTFVASDFKNPQSFLITLRDRKDPFTQYLKNSLSADFQKQLSLYNNQPPPQHVIVMLVGEFNKLLKKDIYEKQRVAHIKIEQDIHNLFQQNLQGEDLMRANRSILEAAYPNDIVKK